MQIRVTHDTWGKLSRNQSSQLPGSEKFKLEKGQVLNIAKIEDAGNHKLITASFYIWNEHFERVAIASPQSPPSEIRLKVPYFSQLDNVRNPYGSCNVTSVAMCLAYLGHPYNVQQQLEDELYDWLINNRLSRHSPYDLQKLIRAYYYKDDFTEKAKWEDVKAHLANGNPAIAHGWFTRSGHIVTLVGYNSKGWLVHDPYGEWFNWGYDTSRSGEYLTYSYEMMREICGDNGDLWIHYVSKG